jgi:hypothetical protein
VVELATAACVRALSRERVPEARAWAHRDGKLEQAARPRARDVGRIEPIRMLGKGGIVGPALARRIAGAGAPGDVRRDRAVHYVAVVEEQARIPIVEAPPSRRDDSSSSRRTFARAHRSSPGPWPASLLPDTRSDRAACFASSPVSSWAGGECHA